MSVSREMQYMKLSNDLRDLKTKRDKIRPALYWLGVVVFLLLAFIVNGLLWTILFFILAIAALLAGLTAWSMRGTLLKQITALEAQVKALEAPAPPAAAAN